MYFYHANNFSSNFSHPSIVKVVSSYISLLKVGKELVGLCPFHAEKRPSFHVNEEKEVYHCFGCGEGGDVIKFIQNIENLDFRGTLTFLGIEGRPLTPAGKKEWKRKRQDRERIEKCGRVLFAWVLDMSNEIAERMRSVGSQIQVAQDVMEQIDSADTKLLTAEIEKREREWAILETLDDDLANPDWTLPLWRQRSDIKSLLEIAT